MPNPAGSPPPRPPLPPRQPSEDLNQRRSRSDGKSIWNLRFLLSIFIPILLGIIGWGLWQAHQSNQQLAQDQQRATTLQTYIDNMRNLLVDHNLNKSATGDEVRQVARVQTLTTLRNLDADRNRILLQFLQEAHLIGTQDAVISLSDADLSNADLSGTDLSGIDLAGANLTGAQLNGADLSDATLYGADLDRTNLSNVNLNFATLTGASLGDSNVNGASLAGARLNGAIVKGAQLNGANLTGADLSGADLTGTDLSGANLSDANLGTPYLTQQQLDTVNSCTNAAPSPGLTCHHNPKIILTYWYTESQAEKPVIVKLINQFQQQNPYIEIKPTKISFFQAQTAFITAVQKGQAPDILRSDVGWVSQFASERYLLNIDSFVSQDDLSDYNRAPLGSASFSYDYYNGHLYGLPQVTDFLALLYNKAELEKAGITLPPATMANFERDAKKVVQSKTATYGFETDGTGYNVLPFLFAFGGSMFDQHNNILVNNAGSVAGLNFLLKLRNYDKVMPTNVNSRDNADNMVNDFMSGKTAMIFDGPYYVSKILTGSSFKGHPGNLGIGGIPTCPTGTPTCHAEQTGSPLGGQSYVISAGTAHPFEAYKFISFMSSTHSQIAIAKANHTLPTRRSAYQNNEVSSDRFISEFLPLTRTAVARPAIPQAGYLFDALDPNIAAALHGIQSPTVALTAVADAWQQLLVGSSELTVYPNQTYHLLSPQDINNTPSQTSFNNVNWESPATWAEIATAAGIVTGSGTLFVGWNTRRGRRREENRRQQQEWAVLEVETMDVVRYELDTNRETGFSARVVNDSHQRLELLLKQVQDGLSAFIKLNDPGNTAARATVLLSLHNLIHQLSGLTRDYLSVSRLLAVQEDRPGDLELRNVISRVTASIESGQEQIRNQLSELKPAIGDWLVKSGAIEANVMDAIITQPRPPELTTVPSGQG